MVEKLQHVPDVLRVLYHEIQLHVELTAHELHIKKRRKLVENVDNRIISILRVTTVLTNEVHSNVMYIIGFFVFKYEVVINNNSGRKRIGSSRERCIYVPSVFNRGNVAN